MLKTHIYELGFDRAATIDTALIPFDATLADLCAKNHCGSYGKNYTCPPHVGRMEELSQKVRQFSQALVFQKVYPLEDSFDYEGMVQAQQDFNRLTAQLHTFCRQHLDHFLLLGAGACTRCAVCAVQTNEPCRFPREATASLESYCIQVSSLAKLCQMAYLNGKDTVTYFGAIFL